MSTINDLAITQTVSSADKLPIWSNSNGVTRGLPLSVLDSRYVTQDDIALLAISPTPETFTAGDGVQPNTFVPGVTLSLTLANQYYSAGNIEVFFDGTFQGPDQYSLIGFGLSFNSPIPVGVQKVYIRGGAARLTGSPSSGTVTDASIASGTKIYNRINDTVSVKDFGAKGDGVANDTVAFQTAVNSGAAAVFVPPGIYNLSPITIPFHVRLFGSQTVSSGVNPDLTKGSWIYCRDKTNPTISVRSGSSVENLFFYYPDQVTDLTGSDAPIVYPSTIQVAQDTFDCLIQNCFFANSYIAIDNSPISGNATIRIYHCYGYALSIGIFLSNGVDVSRIHDCLFSQNMYPGGAPGAGLISWVQNNGIAFQIARQDGGKGSDCFAFGYKYGYYNINSTGGWQWVNCSADGCKFPFNIQGTSNAISIIGCSLAAINFSTGGADPACDGVTINTTGSVLISGTRFGYSARDALTVIAASKVVVTGNSFESVGQQGISGGIAVGIRTGAAASHVHVSGNTIDTLSQPFAAGALFATGSGFTFNNNVVMNTSAQPAVTVVSGCNNYSVVGNTWINSTPLLDQGGAVNKQVAYNLSA